MSISGNYQCPDWVDYPIAVYGAAGGLLEGIPIICGGKNIAYTTDKCYKITAKNNEHVFTMSTVRSNAAFVTINDSRLWITGGADHSKNILSSSEFIQLNGTIPGPKLPIPLAGHTMVNIDNNKIMVIGGESKE